MSRSIFQLIIMSLCSLFWSTVSFAWSTDTIPPGSTHYERSTHALLAEAAYSHFRRDAVYQDFLRANYGISSFDEFLKDVYGLENGANSSFHFVSGLGGAAQGDGIAEYAEVDREFQAGRFERTLQLPREIRDDAHELPWPFPVFQDSTELGLNGVFIAGAMLEDNEFPRTDHHFHDPVSNRGLNQWLPRLWWSVFGIELPVPHPEYHDGSSAAARALNLGGASGQVPTNYYSLPDAERYLYRALVGERAVERETAAALHFLAFGHVLHLLQDMSQPAHVRNDSRVGHVLAKAPLIGRMIAPVGQIEEIAEKKDARDFILEARQLSSESALIASRPRAFLEDFVQRYGPTLDPGLLSELNAHIAATEAQLPVLDAAAFEPQDFFDRELNDAKEYVPGSAFAPNHDPSAQNLGLAEFVNGEFFSDGTVGTTDDLFAPEFASPPVSNLLPSSVCKPLPFRHMDGTIDKTDGVPTFADAPEFSLFVSSPGVPHLLRCGYHALTAEGKVAFRPESSDEAVLRDYFELLFPLAIQYQEAFMKTYFRPRLEVRPAGGNRFQLVNLTPHLFVGDVASLEVVYEVDPAVATVEAERHRLPVTDCVVEGGGSVFVLEPAAPGEARGPVGNLNCAMPVLGDGDPEPAIGAKIWVVARGQHGTRGEVGTPADYDLPPDDSTRKDFVPFFARVPFPRIATSNDRKWVWGETEALDAIYWQDIIAFDIDLAVLEHATEYVAPRIENLTAPIREALGIPEVDFFTSAMRPGSPSEMALRTDLPSEPEAVWEEGGPTGSWPVPWKTGVVVIDLTKSPERIAESLLSSGVLPLSLQARRFSDPAIAPVWSRDGDALFYFGSADGSNPQLHRLRSLEQELSAGIVDSYTGSGQTTDGNGWVDSCGLRSVVSARAADDLVAESVCQRMEGPDNDGKYSFVNLDLFLREARWDFDPSGPAVTTEASLTRFFDMNLGRIIDCPSTGACTSNAASGSPRGTQPHVSPDGTKVAFLSGSGVEANCAWPDQWENQIWIAALEGQDAGKIQKIIENPVADAAFYSDPSHPAETGVVVDLTWSPDGQWLAFTTARSCSPDGITTDVDWSLNLYLMRVDDALLAGGAAEIRLVARGIGGWPTFEGANASLTWIPGLTLNREP